MLNTCSENRKKLLKVESAVFSVSLEGFDFAGKDLSQRCQEYWHGDGCNRYFDKSIQFIVSRDGYSGLNGEHSMMDGTITHRLCESILKEIAEGEHAMPAEEHVDRQGPIEILDFTVSRELELIIEKAKAEFSRHKEIHSFSVCKFFWFGKNQIKEWKFSPDSFVQMAFQLACFRLKGHLVATYESTQTRTFAYGRTEVTRSASQAALDWVRAMQDEGIAPLKKYELLRSAVSVHSEYAKDASKGLGIDRHLAGLSKMVLPDEQQPEFFQDPSYLCSKHWVISTSQISSKFYEGWGWGEVVAEGFGVPYSILDDLIFIGVSSRHGEDELFKKAIQESLLAMQQLVHGATLLGSQASKL